MDTGTRAEQLAGGIPAPAAGGWPPPYRTGAAGLGPGNAPTWPPASWPSIETLDYTTKAITTALLLLALPAIVALLLTRPDALLVGLGRKHIA